MNPRLIARGIPELFPMKRGGDPRSHVSYIVRDLCLKLGHFESSDDPNPNPNLMELGSTFEDLVADKLAERYARNDPDRYARPGELELDGLIGTMDLMDMFDWAVIEVKLTKMSSRHDIESDKFWKYWVQLQAYCKMIGTRRGRLHIGFINGDYRGLEVDYQVWEDEFTDDELNANWRMLVSHHKLLMRAA